VQHDPLMLSAVTKMLWSSSAPATASFISVRRSAGDGRGCGLCKMAGCRDVYELLTYIGAETEVTLERSARSPSRHPDSGESWRSSPWPDGLLAGRATGLGVDLRV
jgi:hypothetical protein